MDGPTTPFILGMKTNTPTTPKKVQWLSDLHLDKVPDTSLHRLLSKLAHTNSDGIVITGDITTARHLVGHLGAIASAVSPRKVYFVCGNHDYYGSSISEVDAELEGLCRKVGNLYHLTGEQIIPLNNSTCLIGHRGWPDARAGYGQRTYRRSPDHRAIRDFHGLTQRQALAKMAEMGKESARVIRLILPRALSRYQHVILMTHIPPFPEVVIYDNKHCSPVHLPHYVNLSAGLAIKAICRAFPHCSVTVLAGHTHHAHVARLAPNLCVRVAGARPGMPKINLLDIVDLQLRSEAV